MKPACIHVHAFKVDEEGNSTACEEFDRDKAGYSVWTRLTPTGDPMAEEFDIGEDEDFEGENASGLAMARAEALSALYGVPVEEY